MQTVSFIRRPRRGRRTAPTAASATSRPAVTASAAALDASSFDVVLVNLSTGALTTHVHVELADFPALHGLVPCRKTFRKCCESF